MNCKFINVLMFAAGAAIGSAVTWKVVKTRYERIAQEEINSVKEVFAERLDAIQGDDENREVEEDSEERPGRTRQINWAELEDLDEDENDEERSSDRCFTAEEFDRYAELLEHYNGEYNSEKKGGAEKMAKRPYVISPYDFGELDGYHQIELTYYADGILEDDEYNIVKDIDELIGVDSLNTFGEYEDDAVFVRNEYLKTDFQILKDYSTYDEARTVGPKQVDDE